MQELEFLNLDSFRLHSKNFLKIYQRIDRFKESSQATKINRVFQFINISDMNNYNSIWSLRVEKITCTLSRGLYFFKRKQ